MSKVRNAAAERVNQEGGALTHKEIILILVGLMSGMFLSALDQSVVGTAMRTIADDLQGLELQAWVTTAYLITSTISTPIYGKLGDIFGRRRLFLIAICIFVFGSILSVFATSMYELAAYRAVQGLGAGGLFALAITILSDIVPPRERARYQGFILAVFASSSVLGPVVGGLFSGAHEILFIAGWKWIFLINIPFGAAALFLVWRFMHVPHTPVKHRIDWLGALTIVLGVVPMLLVAENGRQWGWASTTSIAMYAISVVGIVSFILAERAAGEEAILPLKLFKNRTFSLTTILGVIVGIGMFGGMMTLPMLLQIVNGVTPTQSGFLMLPMVAGMMTATTVSGQITSKTGKYKIFMVIGTGMLMLGYVSLFGYHYDTPIWAMSISMVVIGMGLGQLMQTLTLAAQNAVDARDIGVATSSTMFFRQMGGTLGVAVFISLLFNSLKDKAPGIFAELGQALKANPNLLQKPENSAFLPENLPKLNSEISKDASFLAHADKVLAHPIQQGYAEAAATVFGVSTIVMLVAFGLSFFVKEVALRSVSGVAANAAANAAEAEAAAEAKLAALG